jgi:hypothetical protein
MWICPKCERTLRTANQWHYCEKVELEALFEGKQPIVSDLFDALLLEVMDCHQKLRCIYASKNVFGRKTHAKSLEY